VTGVCEETRNEASAQIGIAPRRSHSEQFDAWTGQQQGQRKGVVNVVADVGVEDDFVGRGRLLCVGSAGGGSEGSDDQRRGDKQCEKTFAEHEP
jgi:hypothetical protein